MSNFSAVFMEDLIVTPILVNTYILVKKNKQKNSSIEGVICRG